MQTRRELLMRAAYVGGAVLGLHSIRALARRVERVSLRPPIPQRTFSSAAVEATVRRVKKSIVDPEIAWLFENCYPNSLDTTVTLSEFDGKPDTFIVTGDIPAMWLRDSSAQVWPYLALAKEDAALQWLYRGLIHRHARCILRDPYANAFSRDSSSQQPLSWAAHDLTEMKPGVAERKWEIDSLCFPIRLAHGYWRASGDREPFDDQWRESMRLVVQTFREQQRRENSGPYRFQRATEVSTDTLAGDGYGVPTRKVGLIHSMFRPADDACTYPFLIPANLFAVRSLRDLATMARAIHADEAFATECEQLAAEVNAAIEVHGCMRDEQGRVGYAYEVDGYGNQLFMDDANIPGLLSLPYLGCCSADDARYHILRERCLGARNPYFFKGTAAEGIGGPHVGPRMIWPMSIIVRALTSSDDAEILTCLKWLRDTHAHTGFMHEAFDQDDPAKFTRPWFAWANSLFGELILDLYRRKPALLRRPLT